MSLPLIATAVGLGSMMMGSKNTPQDPFEGEKPMIWFEYLFDDTIRDLVTNSVGPEIAKLSTQINKRLIETLITMNVDFVQLVDIFVPYQLSEAEMKRNFVAFMNKFLETYTSMNPKRHDNEEALALETLMHYMNDDGQRMMLRALLSWRHDNSNVVLVGDTMQRMFENTELNEVGFNDMGLPPGRYVYVALPGFPGRMLDATSGMHYIRGVVVGSEFIDGQNVYTLSFWGKPKRENGFWEDSYLQVSLTDDGTNIENQLQIVMGRQFGAWYNNEETYSINEETKAGLTVASRIAINTLLYWHNMAGRVDMVHPELERIRARFADLEERLAKLKPGSKRWRGLKATIEREKKALGLTGRWHLIDPVKVMKEGEKPEKKDRDPNKPKRKSPHRHPVRAYWKTVGKKNPYKRFFPPSLRGTGVSDKPRWHKSMLDRFEDLRKQAEIIKKQGPN